MRRIANLVLLSMSNVCFVEDELPDESNVADGDFGSPPATILFLHVVFFYQPCYFSQMV